MNTFAKSAAFLLFATLLSSLLLARPALPQNKKEYLSDAEADRIRDAGMTGPRLVLYAIFAGDRIKKLQYEFAHLDPADEKRTDRINSLINGYTGCIDDAADLLDLGLEKQEDSAAPAPKHTPKPPDSDSEPKKDSGLPTLRGML